MADGGLGIRGSWRLFRRIANEAHRIHPAAIAQDFEVQIRARSAACLAHQGNDLPFLYFLADDDEIL